MGYCFNFVQEEGDDKVVDQRLKTEDGRQKTEEGRTENEE